MSPTMFDNKKEEESSPHSSTSRVEGILITLGETNRFLYHACTSPHPQVQTNLGDESCLSNDRYALNIPMPHIPSRQVVKKLESRIYVDSLG